MPEANKDVEVEFLRYQTDETPAIAVVLDDVAPEYGNIAGCLVAQAGEDIDSGRLARTVVS